MEEYSQEFSSLSLCALRAIPSADPLEEVQELESDAEVVGNQHPSEPSPETETKPKGRGALQVYSWDFEDSVSSVDMLCVSSVSESAKKRYAKFRFHDLQ